jgi:small-conductance mechanosensitive channel
MMRKILSLFKREWNREIPLSDKIAKLFAVNNGSTFQLKGIYILAHVLLVLYIMAAIPWAVWSFILWGVIAVLLIVSALCFVRAFINKAEWKNYDGQD